MSTATANRLSVLEGVAAAIAASLAGGALAGALTPLTGVDAALRAASAAVAAGYMLYLLARSAERAGRVTTAVVWLAVATGGWLSGMPLAGFLLLQVVMLWLVRSLYFYSGVLPALADFALTALGIALASWAAARSGSPFLALWCFFLVQAFAALVPAAIPPLSAERTATPGGGDAFECARRAAENALRRLVAER